MLSRGRRNNCNPILTKRYVVRVVLNGESGFQKAVVLRKLKFGKLLLAW